MRTFNSWKSSRIKILQISSETSHVICYIFLSNNSKLFLAGLDELMSFGGSDLPDDDEAIIRRWWKQITCYSYLAQLQAYLVSIRNANANSFESEWNECGLTFDFSVVPPKIDDALMGRCVNPTWKILSDNKVCDTQQLKQRISCGYLNQI